MRIIVLVLRLFVWEREMACKGRQSLMTWGANSYGQLGLGHKEDTLLPAKCNLEGPPLSQGEDAKQLLQVTGGGGHSVLLTADGQLLVFGWNKNGQLGLQSTTSSSTTPSSSTTTTTTTTSCATPLLADVTIPQPLSLGPTPISKVACGWNHTLATSETGRVFVWGSNTFGQLGVLQAQKQSNGPLDIPQEAFSGARVTDIAAGLRHSMAITVAVFHMATPSYSGTLNPTESGRVYSWGDGRKGQLGHGKGELRLQATPKSSSFDSLCWSSEVGALAECHCTGAAAGAYHSAVVTVDGKLLMWGLNQHGQCAIGSVTEDSRTQPKSDVLENCKLGASNWITNVYLPLRVEVEGDKFAVSEVRCGWSHTVAVTVDRRVFTWGRCDYGQLGGGTMSSDQEDCAVASSQSVCSWEPREVPTLKGAKQIACGSEHTIAIDAAGHVVTFGWNEHGMCGTGDETNVSSPYTVEALSAWRPVMVGSGAGHCLVIAQHRAA